MVFWLNGRLRILRSTSYTPLLLTTLVRNGVHPKNSIRDLSRTASLLRKELTISTELKTPCNSVSEKLESFLSEKNWEKSWKEFCKLLEKRQHTHLSASQFTKLLQLATKQSEMLGEKVMKVMQEHKIHCNSGEEYSAMILFFGKYGRFRELKLLLKEMKEKNIPKDIFVYNALIESFGRTSSSQTYGVYQLLQQESIVPNVHTFEILTKVAESHQDKALLGNVYSGQKKYISNPDTLLYTLMMDVCLKINDLELGLRILKDMLRHSLAFEPSIAFSVLDMLLVKGEVDKGLDLYHSMVQHTVQMNPEMLSIILDTFSKYKFLSQATDIFTNMLSHKLIPSQEGCDRLLKELSKFEDVQQVTRVYEMTQARSITLSDDTCRMILKKCLTDPLKLEQNFEVCQKMIHQGVELDANDVEGVIKRCLELHKSSQAIDLYDSITTQGVQLSPEIQHAISDARKSHKAKEHEKTTREFHSVKDNVKTTREYRSLILNSSKRRDFQQAVRFFEEMVAKNVQPDQYIYTMAMNCYSHCGNGEKVLELWDVIKDLPLPQKARNISASILLDSCGLNSSFDTLQTTWEALKTSKFPLDENNFTSYIEALCKHGKYPEARRVFQSEIEEADLHLSYKTCETVITQFKMSKHRHEFHKLFNYIQAKHPEYFAL